MIFGVKIFQTLHRYRADVATNTALAEHQRHPGFKTFDQTGLDLRVGIEVIIAAIGKSMQQFFHPARAGLVNGFDLVSVQKQACPQILVQIRLTFHFGHAANVGDVVVFDAHEIVFTLHIEHTKNGIGVSFAGNVRYVPFITGDGDALRLGFPAGNFGGAERLGSGAEGKEEQKEEIKWFHGWVIGVTRCGRPDYIFNTIYHKEHEGSTKGTKARL